MAAYFRTDKNVSSMSSSCESFHCPPLGVGERVVWLGKEEPEPGTVKWIGMLPNICTDGWSAGIELDNPVGDIDGRWGGQELFKCQAYHGIVIDVKGLIKEADFLGKDSRGHGSGLKNMFVNAESASNKAPNSKNKPSITTAAATPSDVLRKDQTLTDNRRCCAKVSNKEAKTVADETVDKETLAINKLLNELEQAICNGNLDEAAARARDLAQLKIQCSVTRNRKQPTNNDSDDTDISSYSYHNNKIYPIIVNMYVEDKISHFGPIPIKVLPSMTIGQLKLKMFKEFEFPVHVQRWILGQRLASDDDVKLSSFGVVSDGFPVYLYLLTVGLNELIDRRKENRDSNAIDSPKLGNRSRDRTKCSSKSKRDKKSNVTRTKATGPSENAQQSQQKGDTNTGWPCEKCTLINTPTRSGCAMCGNGRPLDYVLPVNEKIEENRVEQLEEKKDVQVSREEEELRRLNNWQQYLNLDDQDVIHNVDPFECGICLTEVAAGGGVQLRDCLHSFCSECLRNVVSHNEEASVRCPYRDHQYSCDSILQEREIRALVPPDVFERYLRRSIATAESQAPNSFHCKTPDCQGWCLYADNANEFLCPSCGKLNCITCRVIHEGINCKQYQDELAVRARTDDEAKKTKEAIEEMVLKGEAMKCPSCEVIVMKKWGCDWIVCSICKVEICWVTKGPRWGPKGRGDLTGGCKCGVNGVRCHPKCNYCH